MRLDFHGSSVRAARERLRSDLARKQVPAKRAEDARVVLSELVANSLRHAQPLPDGTIAVSWRVRTNGLRVAVTDGGSTSRPTRRQPPELALGGRGLTIVQSLARRWGVEPAKTGTTVWAELDVR